MTHLTRRTAVGLVAVAAILGATACAPTAAESDDTRSITIGADIWALYGGWDPADGAYMSLASQGVYDALFRNPGEGVPVEPWLATEWDLAEDGLTLDVTIRGDVDFSDGTHLDAEALEAALVSTFAGEGFIWNMLVADWGTQVEATGDDTIRFTTTAPMSDEWFHIMSLTPIASPEALAEPGALTEAPVGSGPYLLDEFVPEVSVSFVRNPEYWNPDAFPYDTVEILVYADFLAGLNALKSGQIDVTQVDASLAAEAEAAGFSIHLDGGVTTALAVMDFRGEIQPALADVRVRRAITMAFDREGILANLNRGYGTASSQVIPEQAPGHVQGGDDRYPYDVDAAKGLMAEAGYADGFDLTIPVIPSTAAAQPIIQQSLADIGIRVVFESVGTDVTDLTEALTSGRYAMAVDLLGSSNWFTFFSGVGVDVAAFDPTAADWLELAVTGLPDEAVEAKNRLGELYLDEVWFVPVSAPSAVLASVPEVDVTSTTSLGYPRLIHFQVAVP